MQDPKTGSAAPLYTAILRDWTNEKDSSSTLSVTPTDDSDDTSTDELSTPRDNINNLKQQVFAKEQKDTPISTQLFFMKDPTSLLKCNSSSLKDMPIMNAAIIEQEKYYEAADRAQTKQLYASLTSVDLSTEENLDKRDAHLISFMKGHSNT